MVNVKLGFTDYFFWNQKTRKPEIDHLNSDKALLLPRNLEHFWKIFLKNFDQLKLIFSAEVLHTFHTYQCLQRVLRIFLFCLDPELLINPISVIVQKLGLLILTNNSRSKQNETNLEHPFEHNAKQERCAKLQQKPLNSMVVGAQFFRQNTQFLKNNRALSKLSCGILHYLIIITKLSKKNPSM